MPAPYSSKAVANSILQLCRTGGISDVSPMKLQKLIYYAHAWHLAFLGTPLIREEVQAWKFGPVIEDIYFAFKEFGNTTITNNASELVFNDNGLQLLTPFVDAEDDNANRLLSEIIRIYGSYSPIQLSNLTHADDEPWRIVANQYNEELPRNIEIPNSLIESIFKNRLAGQANG
jgi:uncharacterized phage-associated protein